MVPSTVSARGDRPDKLVVELTLNAHRYVELQVRLLSLGKKRGGKAKCILEWDDVVAYGDGLIAILVTDQADETCGLRLRRLREAFGDLAHVALTLQRRPNDQLRIHELATLAARMRVPTVVTNDVLYHAPERRMLQGVATISL